MRRGMRRGMHRVSKVSVHRGVRFGLRYRCGHSLPPSAHPGSSDVNGVALLMETGPIRAEYAWAIPGAAWLSLIG